MIRFWESASAMLAEADRLNAFQANLHSDYKSTSDWFGGSLAEMRRACVCGDSSLVAEAEKLIDQLCADSVESLRHEWIPSVAGAFPHIGNALRGVPYSMMKRVESRENFQPINIIASTTSSSGISTSQIAARGAAILALCMKLAADRPLSLWSLATTAGGEDSSQPNDKTGETVLLCRVESQPLELASACWQLCSPAFGRRLCYSLAWRLNGFITAWPRGYYSMKSQRYHQGLVTRLGFDPKRTLMIEAIHLRDPLLTDPIAWINTQIRRFDVEE